MVSRPRYQPTWWFFRDKAEQALAALRAAGLALAPREEWRPIESAPKNGTIILLAHSSDPDLVTSGWYESGAADRRWYSTIDQEPVEATHWLPLPAPPATEGS